MQLMKTEEESETRITSVRLKHIDALEKALRKFGFKDRTHFFQLCTDAILQVEDRRLEWPPRFVERD